MLEEMPERERNRIWESWSPEEKVRQGRTWDEEMLNLSQMDGVMRKLVWRGKILDYFITNVDWSDDLGLPEDHPYHEEKDDFTAFVEHPYGSPFVEHPRGSPGCGDVGKYLVFAYITGRMPPDGCPRPNDPVGVQLLERLDGKFPDLDEGETE